ncbi:MAG: hypothetical protein M0Q93_04110 [Terrimicrobiaceae bacterium]|nr:hypothetical protein [Terrimicrobiaceae bacterium]
MNIYVCITGEVKGPFDKKDVFAMLAEKQIALQDSALCEGDSEWATVDEVLKRSAGTLFSFEQIEEARREITPAAFLIADYPNPPVRVVAQTSSGRWISKFALVILILGVPIFAFYGTFVQQWFRWKQEFGSICSSKSYLISFQ